MQSKGQFTHVIIPYSQRTQSGLQFPYMGFYAGTADISGL